MNFHSGGWAERYDGHDHTKSSTVIAYVISNNTKLIILVI